MRIKKITFALTATLLVSVAVIALWQYRTEVEPYLADAGPAALQASSHFQIVLLLGLLIAGALLLFFAEAAVFRPIMRIARVIERLVDHDTGGEKAASAAFRELADGVEQIKADMKARDAALKEKDFNLDKRLRIEEALAKVARNLLRDPVGGVAGSLRILGRNLDVDVVSFWSMSKGGDAMHCIGVVRDPGSGEFSGGYDFYAPPPAWISEAIRYDRNITINDVNMIPPGREMAKEFIGEYDLKSFLGVPLKVPDSTQGGLVAFGDIKEARTWSKEDLHAIEVVAELLVDYIRREKMRCESGRAEAVE